MDVGHHHCGGKHHWTNRIFAGGQGRFMNAIEIEELKKKFGDVCALDGLSMQVEAGTIFGFLGPNGAGKTTTLRILTGLAHADRGTAWIDGLKVGEADEIPARIGYLPEEP